MRTVRRHIRPKPTVFDGIRFGSQVEALRYGELKLLERVGEISDLEVHPRLPMVINGRKIGRGYLTLDFQYERLTEDGWRRVYEDVKGRGADTRESRVRRQVCEAIHGLTIEVVER